MEEDREVSMVELREWVARQDGVFSRSQVFEHFNIKRGSKKEKDTIYTYVKRLLREGVIEKDGKRSGVYRKRDPGLVPLDFNVEDRELSLEMPFGIEKLVSIFPKSIIVVGGVYNAGKSAFMLNMARMNMEKMRTVYFSSEMTGIRLSRRMKMFGKVNWEIEAYERASDFEDVIFPEALNIIDYLELYDNFFLVGEIINKIFQCLTTGIAVIGLQKNPGVSLGIGGSKSASKAHLYITLDSGVLRIEKAKDWVSNDTNPNGLAVRFKLRKGCEFSQVDDWYRFREETPKKQGKAEPF